MNILKNVFKKTNSINSKTHILLTGGNLNFTHELAKELMEQKISEKYILLRRDADISKNYNENDFINHPSLIFFNCDPQVPEEIEEFLLFLKSHKIQLQSIIHSDHYIPQKLNKSNRDQIIFDEFKNMIKTNIENSFLLNSKLISNQLITINSKILHLLPPEIDFKNKQFPITQPKKLLSESLKNLVKCAKQDLIKNPIFMSYLKLNSCDLCLLDNFYNKNDDLLNEDRYNEMKMDYHNTIKNITYLMSKKVDSLEFGKKFWNDKDAIFLNNKI
jgi:hypothetical protein